MQSIKHRSLEVHCFVEYHVFPLVITWLTGNRWLLLPRIMTECFITYSQLEKKNQNGKYWARHAYVFEAIIKLIDPKSSDCQFIRVNNPDDLLPL